MSGTRLGRGRGGRLAVYAGCGIVVFLLVFLYRAATTEMTRLRELHVQCTHQQEALDAQLQVIFEYKERLEKSLTEEKNSNAAAKHDLQERANRERSLRDKDGLEALQRFNSLHQEHNLLKSEHQDLRDQCEKTQKQALEDKNRLETTLQELRSQIKKAQEDKIHSLEHLKSKYLELETNKTRVDEKYSDLLKNIGNTDSTIEHLRKEVFQLKRELEDTKLSCKASSTAADQKRENKAVESVGQPTVEKDNKKEIAQQQAAPSLQQINLAVNAAKELTVGSSTKSSTNSSSIMSSDKLLPNAVVAPVKSVPRGKLPVGVLPIPKFVDQKFDREEFKKINPNRISLGDDTKNNNINSIDNINNNNNNNNVNNKNNVRQTKNSEEVPGNIEHDADKHVADQILGRQENPPWYRVKPGVQEIGDEPNHLRKLPEHDVALQQGDNEQYDNGDYYKEPQQKNSDINLEEGEEEEEEEEDGDEEPFDYQNNAADKHK
ncbi:probable serine/threonine-protein kinase nek3 [Microplitis demolitor]|uniref:probable serine/threonine-protein kinase nek3 n=1 Tax=Microplitis demolitor TaxID=69319 RepID=UPI0004CD5A89|nr:probable serine/threonine-protein kinase nek3 [Microplitis demolitor]